MSDYLTAGSSEIPRPGAPEYINPYQLGDGIATDTTIGTVIDGPMMLRTASTLACAYHGVRRHRGSIVWGVIWGLAARVAPLWTPALAFAQGFGQAPGGPMFGGFGTGLVPNPARRRKVKAKRKMKKRSKVARRYGPKTPVGFKRSKRNYVPRHRALGLGGVRKSKPRHRKNAKALAAARRRASMRRRMMWTKANRAYRNRKKAYQKRNRRR
jgi:hypothetical protein